MLSVTGGRKFCLLYRSLSTSAKLLNRYVCHLDRSSLSDSAFTSLAQQTVFATPLSRALPRIRLRTRQAPQLVEQKILVTIDNWSPTSRYPDGHFVRALGKVASKEAEQESLLLEYEVPYRPFGKAILNCLPPEGDSWVVPKKDMECLEWRDREDLRGLDICSIDPPGCQDIDDALHARRLPNGNIEAGVRKFILPSFSSQKRFLFHQQCRYRRRVTFCTSRQSYGF